MRTDLEDGLYQVDRYGICAGFVVLGHKVTHCAPILYKKLAWWVTIAKRVVPEIKPLTQDVSVVE